GRSTGPERVRAEARTRPVAPDPPARGPWVRPAGSGWSAMLTDPSAHRPIGLELHQAVADASQETEVRWLGPPGGGDAIARPGAAGGSGTTAGKRCVDPGHIGGQGARAGDAA